MAVKKAKTETVKAGETEAVEETAAENTATDRKTDEAPAEKPKEEATKEASFFMYLGPTILGVIQHASIFAGTRKEVEAKLAAAIGKYPRIRALLVSGETLPADHVNVSKPGTRLNAEYAKLVRELNK